MKCNGDRRLLILHGKGSFDLNVYMHYIEPRIERIIWIGFYKNKENKKCFVKTLPKDLIIYILYFLGKQSMIAPYVIIS